MASQTRDRSRGPQQQGRSAASRRSAKKAQRDPINRSPADNPRLPRFAAGSLIAICVGVVLGVALLAPAVSIPRWPWDIKPFNARFIGVFYLAGWLGALYAAFSGRVSPARGFILEAAVFTGVARVATPVKTAAFWPWPVDAFHARVYSGIFFAGTAVLWGLRRRAAAADLAMAGLLQTVLGLGAILGTWSIDLTARRVAWSAPGTWLWLILFGGMALAGLGMLAEARSLRSRGG